MKLVSRTAEIHANIDQLASYLSERSGLNREFSKRLVQRGICFVIATRNGRDFFAPSRFVGYKSNSRHAHEANNEKDGRQTNLAITRVLGREPKTDARSEREYVAFCSKLGVPAHQRAASASEESSGTCARRPHGANSLCELPRDSSDGLTSPSG